MVEQYAVSIRRATSIIQIARSSYYYVASPRDDRAERKRICEIAEYIFAFIIYPAIKLTFREQVDIFRNLP